MHLLEALERAASALGDCNPMRSQGGAKRREKAASAWRVSDVATKVGCEASQIDEAYILVKHIETGNTTATHAEKCGSSIPRFSSSAICLASLYWLRKFCCVAVNKASLKKLKGGFLRLTANSGNKSEHGS